MKKAIATENAPSAIGPYSQGIIVGNMVFVSGQLPIDPKTNSFASDEIKGQTKQSFENAKAILEKAGLSLENVVKTTVFLKNLEDFAQMNEVYSSYFNEPYPARSAFEVSRLPKDALVEIEMIAIK